MERLRKVEEIAMLPPSKTGIAWVASKIIMEVALSIPEMSDKLREEMAWSRGSGSALEM